MTSRRALTFAAIVLTVTLAACTGDGDVLPTARDSTARCIPGPECPGEATSDGVTYLLECEAVPEVLVDIELPREPGRRAIRAIAGVSSSQGVAAMWRDPAGCGEWILGLAEGLSPETAGSIRDEMARGVERFGVTASPTPEQPGEE